MACIVLQLIYAWKCWCIRPRQAAEQKFGEEERCNFDSSSMLGMAGVSGPGRLASPIETYIMPRLIVPCKLNGCGMCGDLGKIHVCDCWCLWRMHDTAWCSSPTLAKSVLLG